MSVLPRPLLLGEHSRSLDERHRLSLPPEWAEVLAGEAGEATLAKERPGCVSIWNAEAWTKWLDAGVALLESKAASGRFDDRIEKLQTLGRLLSTRHRTVPVAGRGRLAIPETFRDFLGVEPGGAVQLVGAAVCVEIWRPDAWARHIGERMPGFRELFDELTE